jgi:hypothetical protein
MADNMTRADSLRQYLTGAASDGGTQTSPDSSLGNFRSSTEAVSMSIVVGSPVSGLTVDYASGANPVGAGSLIVSTGNVCQWQPAGAGSAGPAQTIASGETKVLEANGNPGQYIRVSCSNNSMTPGTATVTLAVAINNVFGMTDVSSAQAAAGGNDYRGVMLKNVASGNVASTKIFIAQVGTSQTSNSAQLGSSGSGTITTTGSLSDWPASGFAQIRTSGGTLRETVYYSSRTGTSLTVPAAGRAMLGTSAAAGNASDTIHAVPGIAIAIDTAGVTNAASIQTIANGNAAPTSVTWNQGLTANTGLQVGTLAAGQQCGIWIWRATPVGAISAVNVLTPITLNFDAA